MEKQKIKSLIEQGNLVECTEEDYKDHARGYLLDLAGEFADQNQGIKGIIALEEVKRLDDLFNH